AMVARRRQRVSASRGVSPCAKNVFVAESTLGRIRKVTPAGQITTYATVTAKRGSGRYIGGLAMNSAGGLVVADVANGIVRTVSQDGTMSVVGLNRFHGMWPDRGDSRQRREHFIRGLQSGFQGR